MLGRSTTRSIEERSIDEWIGIGQRAISSAQSSEQISVRGDARAIDRAIRRNRGGTRQAFERRPGFGWTAHTSLGQCRDCPSPVRGGANPFLYSQVGAQESDKRIAIGLHR